jgi:GntR family transcriptional regulator
MYAQIASQVRVAVASGELGNGDPLPSVRMLASQLRVNPATVVQAYRELEGEGVVGMRQGAGTFVASLRDGHRPRARQAEARRLAREILERATRAGITRDELRAAIDSELGGIKS